MEYPSFGNGTHLRGRKHNYLLQSPKPYYPLTRNRFIFDLYNLYQLNNLRARRYFTKGREHYNISYDFKNNLFRLNILILAGKH